MRRPEFIARQSSCPSGPLGSIIASIMRRETAATNDAALALLGLEPGDRLLEVGFGHGRTLAHALRDHQVSVAAGIDVSETMTRRAKRDLSRYGDRTSLHTGSSDAIPFPAASFDAALAIHVIYFWSDPRPHLRELRRIVAPGGTLVLGYRPASDEAAARSFPGSVYRFLDVPEVEALLLDAGFDQITSTPAGSCVLSRATIAPEEAASRSSA